jgi:hypothetical protein
MMSPTESADIGLQLANAEGSAQRPPEVSSFHAREPNIEKRRSRRNLWIIAVSLLAIIGLTAGLVAKQSNKGSPGAGAPNGEKSATDVDEGRDFEARMVAIRPRIAEAMGSAIEAKFLDSSSPQSQALDWLVFEDLSLALDDMSGQRLLQRYALLAFAFSTNIELWSMSPENRWHRQFAEHECDFVGVDCDSEDRVTAIELDSRNLSGVLPEDIALLTSLTMLSVDDNSLQGTLPEVIYENLFQLGKIRPPLLLGVVESFRLSLELSLSLSTTDIIICNVSVSRANCVRLCIIYFPLLFTEYIGVSLTRITGSISAKVGELTNLQAFRAEKSLLDGPLPDSLKELTDMRTFHTLFSARYVFTSIIYLISSPFWLRLLTCVLYSFHCDFCRYL